VDFLLLFLLVGISVTAPLEHPTCKANLLRVLLRGRILVLLYFKASLVSPPAAYTSSSTNLGSLAPGQSGFFIFTPERHPPTLTGGEYYETLTFRIDAYTDSGYSAAYANQTLSVSVHHFDHADAAWTVVEHAAFDNDLCGWNHIGGY
jgi:hypothetical protein